MPVGTTIEVRNLFFNVPVRRKFMKSVTTEFGHVSEAFLRLAIPHPNVHFTLTHQGKVVYDLVPEANPVDRIARIFSDDVARSLVYVESKDSEIKVYGHVSHPQTSRNNNRMQYFFLNGRHVRDRALQHALNEAYKGLLTVGRFPIAFLHVEMPPDQVDVNVHPTKMEVRFLDSNRVYAKFLGAIRERFLTLDAHAAGGATGIIGRGPTRSFPNSVGPPIDGRPVTPYHRDTVDPSDNDPRSIVASGELEQVRQTVIDWVATIQTPPLAGTPATTQDPQPPLTLHKISNPYPKPSEAGVPAKGVDDEPLRMIQLHDRYLVLQTKTGIGIIDQHALHERLLYDKLKEQMDAGPLDSQRLLVPQPIDLSAPEAACVRENAEFLAELGFTVEPFGGDTVLLNGYPAMLGRVDPAEAFAALLEPLVAFGKKLTRSELVEKTLHSMACKAAVKAGERLREDSLEALSDIATHGEQSRHCPHGRPAIIEFTCVELDKMFRRS
jgi:DNA mismatch repair protein MutL